MTGISSYVTVYTNRYVIKQNDLLAGKSATKGQDRI
jgi:hypothetical protein